MGQGSGWCAVHTHNWTEAKVIVRFWIIGIILGLVSLSALELR
jgi:UDP-N-acetylmuramyl pentapeptide phosphotransferase/UDP-N-acetylglucosamine-1-phosphate transferase